MNRDPANANLHKKLKKAKIQLPAAIQLSPPAASISLSLSHSSQPRHPAESQ